MGLTVTPTHAYVTNTPPAPSCPTASGHLTSVTKLIAMLGSSAHFNPITGASAEANLEAIHLFTGAEGGCRGA